MAGVEFSLVCKYCNVSLWKLWKSFIRTYGLSNQWGDCATDECLLGSVAFDSLEKMEQDAVLEDSLLWFLY